MAPGVVCSSVLGDGLARLDDDSKKSTAVLFFFALFSFYGCVSWICFILPFALSNFDTLNGEKTKLNVLWFMHHVFYASVNLL